MTQLENLENNDELSELFKADSKIEKATQKLFQLDDMLKEICEQIKSDLNFEFAAISLVDKERNIIEALQGTQELRWINLAKHYLEPDKDLRDIQADICDTRYIEVISGNDPRFDDCIYDSCNHKDLIRVFMPILVIESDRESDDDRSRFVRDWFQRTNLVNIPPETPKPENEGQHQRYELKMSDDFHQKTQVIGTVEAGYFNPKREISSDRLRELAQFLANAALQICETRLEDVLKAIATETKKIMKAHSATLHYLRRPNNSYVYEELSGFLRRDYLKKCPPRRNGLGQKAIETNQPQWISNSEELGTSNAAAYGEGLRAMAAFPLNFGHEHETGVLYVSYTQIHNFDETEIERGKFLARRLGEAIRYARIHRQAKYRQKQLTTLHEIAQSLLDIQQEETLLRRIAGYTRNILAADVVTIYEYIQSERRFLTPPDIAGKLKTPESTSGEGHRLGIPLWLIDQKDNLYASVLREHEVFQNSRFDKQENICSVAGVKLMVDSQVVGVMFINYRRPHEFLVEERQLIETLASHAAIAIKNRRSRDEWLGNLADLDRQIITALDKTEEDLLKLVVERAFEITGADLAEILMPNLINRVLEVKSSHPSSVIHDIKTIQLGQGITGQVAIDQQSRLVNDVQSERQYIAGRTNIGSEVCVPLLDQYNNLLGVLNVESYSKNAFTQRHQRNLQSLADRAVIVIQTLKNNEKSRETKLGKQLSIARSEMLHKTKNDLGPVEARASAIVEILSVIQDKPEEILELIPDILNNAKKISDNLIKMVQDAKDLVRAQNRISDNIESPSDTCNLRAAIDSALTTVELPEHIEIRISGTENLPAVCCSLPILLDILDNLIRNAKDALQGQGCLSISCEVFDDTFDYQIKVEICDTGSGISVEEFSDITDIFEPNVTTKATGMGWGLTIVKANIESLQGSIEVDNQPEGGARFTFLLPAKRSSES
jgi:signal transduction histidine kinase